MAVIKYQLPKEEIVENSKRVQIISTQVVEEDVSAGRVAEIVEQLERDNYELTITVKLKGGE